MSDNPVYAYSALPRRPVLRLPDGHRMALYVVVAVEHYLFDQPGMSIAPHSAHFVPDPLNYSWRDYGPRVGVWRIAEILERHGVPATAVLNSDACRFYPEILEEGSRNGWSWVAHGKNNNLVHQDMDKERELEVLTEITETIAKTTGQTPRGWIGPVLSETMNTPALLAELGYTHILDWGPADDQPFMLTSPAETPLVTLPYALELNDATLFVGRNLPGPEFERALIDQFETLYRESAHSARVMNIALHPWIAGQSFRTQYLERAISHIAQHEDVWLATSDQIAEWYIDEVQKT
jgi:peptidoglycan/xylan/chitin deacetylase (PgdA/CDA1 family)